MANKFTIPLQSEVAKYMKEKKGWPDKFCSHYAEKFWNHYQASGWKLSSGNSIKDWKACFNAQWQTLKFKEDIDILNGYSKNGTSSPSIKKTDTDRLDAFLDEYRQHPSSIPFDQFGVWYEFLKTNRLMREFTAADVERIRSTYNGDKMKCRCACVQMTFDSYCNSGITFSKIMEIRKQLA